MSGALLGSQFMLIPRLTPTAAWTTTSIAPTSTTIFANSTGTLVAVRDGGADVDLGGWISFQTSVAQQLFEAMLSLVSGSIGFSDMGVWRDLAAAPTWGAISFGDTVSVVRLDIRLKGSTAILATATYTVTFDV